MKVVITNHAKIRMKMYLLNEQTIIDAINNPDEIVPGFENARIAHKLHNEHVLRIIFIEEKSEKRIVTVYPAKKERYYKK